MKSRFKEGDIVKYLGLDAYTGNHRDLIKVWINEGNLVVGENYNVVNIPPIPTSDLEVQVSKNRLYLPGCLFELVKSIDEVMHEEFNEHDAPKALRYNVDKPKWSLVHFASLIPMIEVLTFGAIKYAPHNWKKPMNGEEILESMQRHLSALFDGETHDKESKLHHIGHIMANAMFYSYHYVINKK
jgi:hypothetical protein